MPAAHAPQPRLWECRILGGQSISALVRLLIRPVLVRPVLLRAAESGAAESGAAESCAAESCIALVRLTLDLRPEDLCVAG